MNLQTLLGHIPLKQFVVEHYQRFPYAASIDPEVLRGLVDWPVLVEMLADESADVVVCRRNERLNERPRDEPAAAQLLADGYTLLVRHAERNRECLADLAQTFERDFAAPVDIHVYCTPAGEHGFGWHYDAEEVFIVQVQGRKEFALRKNTVNPWPITDTLPADMQYEREIMPLWRSELAAGDWLYIPSGYWHKAVAFETAISLAIGVQPRTLLDFLDWLRKSLRDSLVGRQRLPVCGAANSHSTVELAEALTMMLDAANTEFKRQLRDPASVESFLRSLRNQP